MPVKKKFSFIDLFAGIGGMRLAFQNAGGECVFSSEWNKFSVETYKANFGSNERVAGDITGIPAGDIPKHDVLVAGFPCQPFSLAGVSKKKSLGRQHGFLDQTQGTLFFDIARILEYHQPQGFLLENVKNLLSHNGGKTFEIINSTLEKLGYQVSSQVISSHHWVPQKRERIFITGFKREKFDFSKIVLGSEKKPKLIDILHPEDGTECCEEPFTYGDLARVHEKYTLSDKLWTYLKNYSEKHKAAGNGFGYGLVTPEDVARTLSARYYKDGSEILVKQPEGRPRRLTPRECARLMGFTGGFLTGKNHDWQIPVSDTQAYQQFGNSVVVPLVTEIATHMTDYLN